MRVCLWIKLKLLFLKPNSYSLWCGLDILTIFFFIWTHGEQELQTFLRSLNEFHTDIKFTYESSKESIAFLDLKVSVKNSKIITDLYVKSTDRHQYLHYLSAHPNHTKRSVVFSQTLRISRLCSYEENFIKHKANMKSWFLKREYPERLISAEMDKVKFSNIERRSNSKTQKGIPLVVTYHPLLKSLSSIVNNNIYLLHMDQEVKRTFTPQPMVSYRSARKLSSYLVRAKLYPIERKVGSCKCKGKRCEVCKNVLETDTFTCSNDQTTYKINHKFDCNEKCLVYLITCNKCLKQYVGQTVDMFRSRWNNYKDNSRKFDRGEDCMQKYLYEHFQLPGHTGFLQDTYVTLIDKTDPRAPTKREDYWIHTLKTKAPMGLNVEGGY